MYAIRSYYGEKDQSHLPKAKRKSSFLSNEEKKRISSSPQRYRDERNERYARSSRSFGIETRSQSEMEQEAS